MAHRWLLGLVSLGALAFVACGETSRESDSNDDAVTGAGGGIAGTDPDVTTATQSGTTGTGGASALATNVMAASSTASTGSGGASMHCHTLLEVDEAIETIGYGPIFGNGGQAGEQPSEECPRYYPTLYGPPCGGELLPGSTELRCCYSYVDCN